MPASAEIRPSLPPPTAAATVPAVAAGVASPTVNVIAPDTGCESAEMIR